MAPRDGPVDRVRRAVARELGAAVAAQVPRGYTRLGCVLVVRLPEALRPAFPALGRAYAEEFGVRSVLRPAGGVEGEFRHPRLERIHGEPTETEVVEHGTRFRFDPERIMFARGNKTERARIAALVAPGERVYDLFAGIGYFAIPIARRDPTIRVVAVEANALSFGYLTENVARNGVGERVTPIRGDNRVVPLPPGPADRVVLGYLPSALPYLPRAIELLGDHPGTVHVHLVANVRDGVAGARAEVAEALARYGAEVERLEGRAVKPYGPGRVHVVIDARVAPPALAPAGA
jgi:tRNA wybutosine-synthesizing protein 2